ARSGCGGRELRVVGKRGEGRGERTGEIEEKPVFIAGYSSYLMSHHGILCCLENTTDPRGTKPSVVRCWANLVTGYLLAGSISVPPSTSATARLVRFDRGDEGDGSARHRLPEVGVGSHG